MIANKLGIQSEIELARVEERLSKLQAKRLFESGVLDSLEAWSFESLRVIHKGLFGEIYEFAGEVREVNISKGGFRFAPVTYLKEALLKIQAMPQGSFEEIVEKYVEMNVAHPFFEGNGRSMRIWLDVMLKKELGKVVDWSKIAREDYLMAMERSPIRDIELKILLKGALSEECESSEVFMRGIDASYEYEGYCEHKMREIE